MDSSTLPNTEIDEHNTAMTPTEMEYETSSSSSSKTDLNHSTGFVLQQKAGQKTSNSCFKKEACFWTSPSGVRRRYQICGDCDYKTVHRSRLVAHVMRKHPCSKTALPPPPKNGVRKTMKLYCHHQCNYQTISRIDLFMHQMILHGKKSMYQCQFCSYSVFSARYLSIHVQRNHPENEISERPPVRDLSVFAVKDNLDFYNPRKFKKVKYQHCGDCNFKAYMRSTIVSHVKKWHPQSSTALPTSLKQNCKPADSYSCSYCGHRFTSPLNLKNHEILHRRKSDHQCEFCSYSVGTHGHLMKHMNQVHSQVWTNDDSSEEGNISTDMAAHLEKCPSTTAPIEKHYKNGYNLSDVPITEKDTLTETTSSFSKEHPSLSLEKDKEGEGVEEITNVDHQCLFGSYTTSKLPDLKHHLNHVHMQSSEEDSSAENSDDETEVSSTSSSFEEVEGEDENSSENSIDEEDLQEKTEKDWMNQFGLRHCYVKLHDLVSPIEIRDDEQADATNSDSTLSKQRSEGRDGGFPKGIHTDRLQIDLMSNRVKFMEEKARIADEELKKVLCDKDIWKKKIIQKAREKLEAEIDLRTNQCKAIELKLSLHDVDCDEIEEKKNFLSSVEETIKTLEGIVAGMGIELQAIGKEEADLSEEVEDAERSYFGIMQVLDTLKSELKGLQSLKY